MATTHHLYVTLFSNASRDIYEQNTHVDFTVKLAEAVDLVSTSSYEVGLSEICVPHSHGRGNTCPNIL